MIQPWESRLVDHGGSQLIFIDPKHRALWVRAGRVDGSGVVHLRFQQQYINSQITDAILMTAEQWKALTAAVELRINAPSVERRIRRHAARTFAVHRLRKQARARIS